MPMKIGLWDADNSYRGKVTFPNLALMKLSAWHKKQGDEVSWIEPYGSYDKVYISKVFSDEYTKEVLPIFQADEIVRGGSGYAIKIENERECYHKELDPSLPDEIEHIFPDYGLYGITDNAYGFLTRGCPRGCDFCHVAGMQGRMAHTVAELEEFWDGQKYIHLNDPNIIACKDWEHHFEKLAASKAYIDFNQGIDVRLLTEDKCKAFNELKYKAIHFAWDRPEQDLRNQLTNVKGWLKKCSKSNTTVYVLVNNGSTIEEDIARVEFIKSIRMQPYVMVYRESTAPKIIKKLKRYANNPFVCWATPTFADYDTSKKSERHGKTGIKYDGKVKAML